MSTEYPLKVEYCGECSMPPEYCENGPCFDKCQEWLKENLPEIYDKLFLNKTEVSKSM